MRVAYVEDDGWGVFHDDMTPITTGLPTNASAWREHDRIARENMSSSEAKAEWLSRQAGPIPNERLEKIIRKSKSKRRK